MITRSLRSRLSFIVTSFLLILLSLSAQAENSTQLTYFYTDALGSVVATADEQGNILSRRSYQPYGAIHQPDPHDDEPLGYTGKPLDASGLQYMGARYFDPQIGRFMGIDPVAFNPSQPHSFNRYAYANNNPYLYHDPDGQWGLLVKALKVAWKGGDVASTFQGALDDVGTVFSAEASLGERALAAVSLASEVASPVSIRDGKQVLSKLNPCSFVAGTDVLVGDAPIPIERLAMGDTVWALDDQTHTTYPSRVIGAYQRLVDEIILLELDAETLQVTSEHPFWLKDRGWLPASQLRSGDQLLSFEGEPVTVLSVSTQAGEVIVYNITTEHWHTYFAGASRVLVHNCEPGAKATDLPVIKSGTGEWKKTVEDLSGLGKGKMNVRTETATDAQTLLKEARGNMNRYKNYTDKSYKKGYETHNSQNARELGAGNDLQHLKWKDGKSGGHIYYDKPN